MIQFRVAGQTFNVDIHLDYSILGSDIKVAIYDDMLEITSPGPLPDAFSTEIDN